MSEDNRNPDIGEQLEQALAAIEHELSRLETYLSTQFRSLARAEIAKSLEFVADDFARDQHHLEQKVSDKLIDTAAHFENRLTSLNEALVAHLDLRLKQLEEALQEDVETAKRNVGALTSQMRRELDDTRESLRLSSLSSAVNNLSTVNPAIPQQLGIDEQFYAALEDRFRGSQDEITKRQTRYLAEIARLKQPNLQIVDLGCGRGEWLQVLTSAGFDALGVESSPIMVARCQQQGLRVENADLLSFLSTVSQNSIGAFTMFQVVEHLTTDEILATFRGVRKALVDGGVFIAEIPNVKNLRVGAGTFWIDPTHKRPIFPDFLEFVAEYTGFSQIQGLYVNSSQRDLKFGGLDTNIADFLQSVSESLNGPADYALIAIK